MDPCKEREPQIINHLTIAKCLEEQGLKGELGRLAREEGIPWDEVTHIRIEFKNILRIDHIWVLPSLTMLSLSNNLIEKIENLEILVHLTELDLSFNKIKRIENLDELVNLQMLNLFNNEIEEIENLDHLVKLNIFSVGNNNITNRDNVMHLRLFKHLKSVNMAGNPCAQSKDFRTFVVTFLPRIVYYEYKMVEASEREEGQQLYVKELTEYEKVERVIREQQEKIESEIAEAELHSESFVEFLGTSHLFDQMFENDEEGKLLLKVGDEAKEYYNEYETQFLQLTRQIFENGQVQYKIRKEEVDQFMKITEGAKVQNQEESIAVMERFMAFKNELFRKIRSEKESVEDGSMNEVDYLKGVNEYRQTYREEIHKTWKVLMGLELTLYEQMEETNQNFEQALTEMLNVFIEMAQGFFAQIRTAQGSYNELISEMANRYLANITINGNIPVLPEVAPLFVDRDTLVNATSASHDLHLLVIDNREDRLARRARAWLSNMVNDLQKNEIARSRAKVLEINHYLDIQREEYEELIILPEPPPEI